MADWRHSGNRPMAFGGIDGMFFLIIPPAIFLWSFAWFDWFSLFWFVLFTFLWIKGRGFFDVGPMIHHFLMGSRRVRNISGKAKRR
jgi:hypothetical protein